MLTVALRGLLGRKLRAVLTAIAIVLGVAMVSGAFVLTDSMTRAADRLQANSYAGIDAVVTGKALFSSDNDWEKTPPISSGVLSKIRELPDVALALGGILDQGKLVDEHGKVIGQPPNFAVGVNAGEPGADRLNPLQLKSGTWASGPGEVVIDAGTAKREGLKIGDTIGVVPRGPLRRVRVVGLAGWGNVSSIGAATMAAFDLRTAQELFAKRGRLDSISVAGKTGVPAARLRAEIRSVLPSTVQVQTAKGADPFDFSGLKDFVRFIKIFLLAFGGIALFVGAFIIFNTLSITVAQRAREFALLRTIGASRRQVLRSVVVEALVIGLFATAVGIALGLGIAKGLSALMSALNLDLPQAGTVFAWRTVLVSLLVGVVVTLVAGMIPAVRATRVPPVAILREGALLPRSRVSPIVPYAALAAIAAGGASLVYGMFAGGVAGFARALTIGLGTITVFLGVALVSPRLVRPLASVVGWPAARLAGTSGRLARENATRNPGRTAVTASALMIGLTLVTFVAVLGRGIRETWGSTLNKQVDADYVLTTDQGWDSFAPPAARVLAAQPGVEAVSAVRTGEARFGRVKTSVSGIDPSTIGRFYHFGWKAGSNGLLPQLGPNDAILDDDWAREHHLSVGDRFRLETRARRPLDLAVRGLYSPAGVDSVLSNILITIPGFDRTFDRPRNLMAFVATAPTVQRAALERSLERFPDVKLLTQPEFVDNQNKWISDMLNLLYALLGLSVIVSFFGIVNTLVLSTFERTRELGMLRAVGMTRRQVRRMVRHESVITALIGAALGLLLGIALAALVTLRLSKFSRSEGGGGMSFGIPFGTLLVFAAVAALAGVVAAILPARRAARLRILEALQYE